MREFTDEAGKTWKASLLERHGPNYKWRFTLQLESTDHDETFIVEDLAWNSEHTAQRTLDTMSLFELRRRLRMGRTRSSVVVTP